MKLLRARQDDPLIWCVLIALAFLGLISHRLGIPSQIYFDEVHYIPAARKLLQWEMVNPEHPMLGKEIIAAAIGLLGDKPLTVLMQGDASKISAQFSPEERAEFVKVWRELQTDLATRSSNGTLVVAEKSSHYVLLDEPQLVIEALRRACEPANKQTAPATATK